MELINELTTFIFELPGLWRALRVVVFAVVCWVIVMGFSAAFGETFNVIRWALRKWAKFPGMWRTIIHRRQYEVFRLQAEKDRIFHKQMMDTDIYQKKCRELIEMDTERQDHRSRKATIGNLVITTIKDKDENFVTGLILALSPWEVVIAPGQLYSLDVEGPGAPIRGGFIRKLSVKDNFMLISELSPDKDYDNPLIIDWGQVAEVYTDDGERLVDRLDPYSEWPDFKADLNGGVDSTSTAEVT